MESFRPTAVALLTPGSAPRKSSAAVTPATPVAGNAAKEIERRKSPCARTLRHSLGQLVFIPRNEESSRLAHCFATGNNDFKIDAFKDLFRPEIVGNDNRILRRPASGVIPTPA